MRTPTRITADGAKNPVYCRKCKHAKWNEQYSFIENTLFGPHRLRRVWECAACGNIMVEVVKKADE